VEGFATLALLRPGEEAVVRARLVAPRRGPYALRGIRVTTTFPLGLFSKGRVLEVPGELLVYPRRVPPPRDVTVPDTGRGEQAARRFRREGDGDTAGLRPLREGEDARRVHWMKSALADQLLRVERDAEETRSVVLTLDVAARGAALERSCEDVAARARALLAEGAAVGLEAGPDRLRPDQGPRHERLLLGALARAGLQEPAPQ
jgi:uncharacterized protein (DUF58 family)